MKRIPIMNQTEIEYLHDGPENFTADGKWILGESPEVINVIFLVNVTWE